MPAEHTRPDRARNARGERGVGANKGGSAGSTEGVISGGAASRGSAVVGRAGVAGPGSCLAVHARSDTVEEPEIRWCVHVKVFPAMHQARMARETKL